MAIARIGRLLARGATLLFTTSEAMLEFVELATARRRALTRPERAEWLHRWCAVGLARLGIAVEQHGAFPARGLIACNHVSYLDIPALSAAAPCLFVAKREVRQWPVYGWMARLSGTVFVDRERAHDAHRAASEIEAALAEGAAVVLFPEGTSTDGSTVLPFRSPLFQPAIRHKAPLTPAHVGYRLAGEGSVGQDVCYWGEMTFAPHLLRLLTLERITCVLRFGESIGELPDRKTAARRTHELVAALADS
jgi:1-acyl-sn-glycerol-3-phosphate acyltransferase